jgi:hypothetical protein
LTAVSIASLTSAFFVLHQNISYPHLMQIYLLEEREREREIYTFSSSSMKMLSHIVLII